VKDGPFRSVRNPIFTGTSLTWVGIALLVPNPITIVGPGSPSPHRVQVRLVEEPYLRRVHGDAYRAYAARTGRFLPGIGRIRDG
jgi:protein-S-isoprenylcysteine O-methyltransferase Ste14